jgi:hypothetical protein
MPKPLQNFLVTVMMAKSYHGYLIVKAKDIESANDKAETILNTPGNDELTSTDITWEPEPSQTLWQAHLVSLPEGVENTCTVSAYEWDEISPEVLARHGIVIKGPNPLTNNP